MNYEIITDEAISSIKDKLSLYPKWPLVIAEKITRDKQWKTYAIKPCSTQIAINIGNCKVLSQLHRRLFIKYATELLEPIIEEQNKQAATAKRWQSIPNQI